MSDESRAACSARTNRVGRTRVRRAWAAAFAFAAKSRKRLTALALLKGVGLLRELAIIAFSVGQNSTAAANSYFVSSQAAVIFNGRGVAGRLVGGLALAGSWLADSKHVVFSIVVFLPFLLWPRINKAAFQRGHIRGVVALAVIFNVAVFVEMAVTGGLSFELSLPNLFGIPFVALYVTVATGWIVFGISPSIADLRYVDLALLTLICAVRIVGFAWLADGYAWVFLIAMRVVEIFVPQWITLKRIGVASG